VHVHPYKAAARNSFVSTVYGMCSLHYENYTHLPGGSASASSPFLSALNLLLDIVIHV
jgi:hypothetical protein